MQLMVNVGVCVHRENFMALADKDGCYIAIYFPQDSPPAWAWGKPLSELKGAGKENFWLNFTPDGTEYDPKDDIKVKPSALNFDNYGKSWAVVTKRTTAEEVDYRMAETEDEAAAAPAE